MFIYPIPCIPFPFKGEGEDKERGATAPLKRPFILRLFSRGIERGEYGVPAKIYFCGVKSPFKKFLPSPLYEGRGIEGKGLVKQSLQGAFGGGCDQSTCGDCW